MGEVGGHDLREPHPWTLDRPGGRNSGRATLAVRGGTRRHRARGGRRSEGLLRDARDGRKVGWRWWRAPCGRLLEGVRGACRTHELQIGRPRAAGRLLRAGPAGGNRRACRGPGHACVAGARGRRAFLPASRARQRGHVLRLYPWPDAAVAGEIGEEELRKVAQASWPWSVWGFDATDRSDGGPATLAVLEGDAVAHVERVLGRSIEWRSTGVELREAVGRALS